MRFSITGLLATALTFALTVTNDSVFILAGDSTTHNPDGWGDDFLNYTLKPSSFGFNYGESGKSLTPYLPSSYFTTILNLISQYRATRTVFLTCQFGHSDQKNPVYKAAAFNESFYRFVDEITAAGAIPILITPLTRRAFSGGKVIENLVDEANVVRDVTNATYGRSKFIDLNKASIDDVNAIGEAVRNGDSSGSRPAMYFASLIL